MVNTKERKARKIALWILGLMVIIWTVLGILSFVETEGRRIPDSIKFTFAGQNGLKGKQVFQSFNCMDCHTIVGNGAYFAPDLTKIYKATGPAYLVAYLGSPATYPTEALVKIQLNQLIDAGEVEVSNLEEYYEKFPEAQSRVEERGGVSALMPNLKFTKEEINALVAFLKYSSQINTQGWPPEVRAREEVIENMKRKLETESGLHLISSTGRATGGTERESVQHPGKILATSLGCVACHSADGTTSIGPTWKGLFDSQVKLTDGKTVQVNVDYLKRSILQPNSEIVHGYTKGLMPPYEGVISEEDLNRIVDYIKSL